MSRVSDAEHDPGIAGPDQTGPGRRSAVHNVRVSSVRVSSARTARTAASLLVAASLLCFALTVWLDLHTDPDGVGAQYAPGWAWSYTLIGALQGALAAVVLARNVRQGVGWGLAWLGLFWATDGLAQAYVRYGITAHDALPGMNFALWNLNRLGSFLPMVGALLLMLFPTGRFLSGAWRVASWVCILTMAATNLTLILAPAGNLPTDVALPPGIDVDAWTLPLPDAVVDAAIGLVVVSSLGGVVVAMAAVVVRYRRSRELERDRMRWLLWSVVAMGALIALSLALEIPHGGDIEIFLIMVLPSLAMTIAVVDPELVSIERLLARTLVYAILAVVILLADLLVLAALTGVIDDRLGQRQVVLVVLLVSVLLYGPLRQRLIRGVQRVMLGARTDPFDVVAGLATTLESTDEGPEQLAVVASAVADAFRVRYVAVEVERGSGERLVATHGTAPEQTRTLPIVYRGADVGRIILPARGVRSRLSRRDDQLLSDLVRQAAIAARTSELATELQASRERLVTAREEERRRIRRDLHDGLGPALSGVVFRLESARLLVERDPATAIDQIAQTSGEIQAVVADVRRLVHDLRPPALDDLGLVGAIGQLAAGLARGGPVIEVESGGIEALPAAVEVAVYRIVAEALTNVVRHATARSVQVRLCRTSDAISVEVADDGVGISSQTSAGVGLRSMRERAAELGGRLEVSCPESGGTLVRACLPLSATPRDDTPTTYAEPHDSEEHP